MWSASTSRYTLYSLGRRSGQQFRDIGIGPGFSGVAVHDRYAVYDQADNFAVGVRHQLCCSHLLRDLADATETYPEHVWPIQCQRALRGLIHAANLARAAAHTEIEPAVRDALVREFRQAVIVGRKDVPHVGGSRDKQPPARNLLEDLYHRHDEVLRSATTPVSRRRTTSPSVTCGRTKPSRKSPAGLPATPPPPTGWPSAATYPQHSNTASTP